VGYTFGIESRENVKKNVLIVILMILVLAMGCFIIYDKVLKNNDTEEISTEEKENLKNSEITEKFVKFKSLHGESWEENYKIVLNNKNYDLKIENDFDEVNLAGDGNGTFKVYLDDKILLEESYFCGVEHCTNEIYSAIAIYNNNYIVLKSNEYNSGKVAQVSTYHFLDENGFEKQIDSYAFNECDKINNKDLYDVCSSKEYGLYLEDEYIYYYADTNNKIEDYSDEDLQKYFTGDLEFPAVKVYEYKTKLTTTPKKIKELFDIELTIMP